MALNLSRRTAGAPRWALAAALLVAAFLLFPVGCLPSGDTARDLERVDRFRVAPTCGAWQALPSDAQRAFMDGYVERLRERLPRSSVSAADAERVLHECARLDPSTDALDLLMPLTLEALRDG